MKKGLLIVFSGPSGVGKGTIINKLMEQKDLRLCYSVSMTTRQKREGEKEGVNYFFVSEDVFKQAVYNGELLEHAVFVDHFYGTPKKYVEEKRNEGYNVLLEIETVGAKQVMNQMKYDDGCISIFLVPPSIEELEKRIRHRASENEEVVQKRLRKAIQELKETFRYQHVVCNDNVDSATKRISAIIKEAMLSQDDKA